MKYNLTKKPDINIYNFSGMNKLVKKDETIFSQVAKENLTMFLVFFALCMVLP